MDIAKKRKIFFSMAGFVPERILLKKLRKLDKPCEIFDATLCYADISGFTAMSERIAHIGKEGSEELTRVINSFFEPLIKIITKWGGDIYRFGGDAIIAFFPETGGDFSSAQRALGAGIEAIGYVQRFSRVKTRAGVFGIGMHIGLTRGRVYFSDLKSDYFLAGRSASRLIEIVDTAKAGEIVVDTGVKQKAKDVIFKNLRNGLWLYEGIKRLFSSEITSVVSPVPQVKLKNIDDLINDLKPYLPDWLYKRIELQPYFDQSDGEHRKAVVIFLHFSGTSYEDNSDKADTELNTLYQEVKQCLVRYDGWLNKMDVYKDGGRMLVVFGFPKAYEDCEKRAVLFSYEILQASDLKGIDIKIGINAGFIFAGPVGSRLRREWTVMGDTVNLAARLSAHAKNRTIVVSEVVYNKTYPNFEYQPLGKKRYKGKKKEIFCYRVLKKKTVAQKGLLRSISEGERIVGRKAEVKGFKKLIPLVEKSRGQICGITGEPGMGKSRLALEFLGILKKRGFDILSGNCLAYGRALSYHPWVELLKTFFDFSPGDTPSLQRKKIRQAVMKVDKKLTNWLQVIGEVMGITFPETKFTKFLDARVKKQRFFDIVFEFISYLAEHRPTCIVLEDLHWADSVSMELLNYIGRNIGDKKVLLLLVFRPLSRKEEFMEKEFYREIFLKELNSAETAELVENMLDISSLPPSFKRLIIEKSQGNPFYVEEIVKSFIEQGLIYEDMRGAWQFSRGIRDIQIPDNVEGIILNRIDHLDLYERDVLQTASVLGREFDKSIIEGIYQNKNVLKRSLRNLKRLDLLTSQRDKGRVRYFFKHILTQEVAYGTISFARKRELHRTTAEFIETKFKKRRDEFLGLLSHHYYYGMAYDKALQYSVEAGEKAKRVYANEEAIEFFTRAIDSYEKLEEQVTQ
ncbi:hypothetical protein BXT86_03935 [candidate division WOR-3 bacterium 4484_100]|uniref:Guanylate cyclase domain-containing protein n=1 Tax=candidate division WOR-3 bacterium 4484_100 TaxID=1936077 RepID=A0A1V4QG06_UNCW3|nr:MAG: hypothetical protein BXT86_03935 [candidate division WOR-3 bacterium 4484_100]